MKKKILFTVLLLLFVAISYGAFYFIRSKNNLYRDLEYQSLFSSCTKTEEGLTHKIHCPILINSVEQFDDEECFNIEFLSKENDLETLKMCEDKGIIEWNSETMIDDEMKVPVIAEFSYAMDISLQYQLKSVSLILMSDEEISNLVSIFLDKDIEVPSIRTPEHREVKEKEYQLGLNSSIIGGKEIEYVLFYNMDISNISSDGNRLLIEANLGLSGSIYPIKFYTNSVVLYQKEDPENQLEIMNPSNYRDYQEKVNVVYPMFIYFSDDTSSLLEKDFVEYCNNDNLTDSFNSICSNIDGLSIGQVKVNDLDTFLEKSLIDPMELNQYFSKLVLVQMLY